MTLLDERRVQFAGGEVVTPKVRASLRRLAFWAAAALVLVLIAIAALALSGNAADKARLSATSPAPTGAQALVRVLAQDGVAVKAPRTLEGALADISKAPDDTTVVVYDPTSLLTPTQQKTLKSAATNIVLIEPNTTTLDTFAPEVAQAGVAPDSAHADCSLAAVRRAGTVTGLARGYRFLGKGTNATKCLGNGGVYSLLRVSGPNGTVTVFGATTPMTNGSILAGGNAALALGIFGSKGHLVWYRPSLGDTTGVVQDGIIPIPDWVFPLAILAGIVLVAAGIWRGRRLGPVVVERMPVVVRSSETLEGRARLYQKSSARSHALDALRIGAIGRLAQACGLPAGTSVDDVIGAVSRVTRRDPGELRALLLNDLPEGDARLVHLSDELTRLEHEVAAAVRPG